MQLEKGPELSLARSQGRQKAHRGAQISLSCHWKGVVMDLVTCPRSLKYLESRDRPGRGNGSDPFTELGQAERAKLMDVSVENLVFGDSRTLEHF